MAWRGDLSDHEWTLIVPKLDLLNGGFGERRRASRGVFNPLEVT